MRLAARSTLVEHTDHILTFHHVELYNID